MPINPVPWPEGTPAWVDLLTSDLEVSMTFYGELFGWEFLLSQPERTYATALLEGAVVAGLGFAQLAAEPPVWTTYLAVDDLSRVVAAMTAAGAQVLLPPTEVIDEGAMATLRDPTGAVVGLWKAGRRTGVDRFNEAGTLLWNEAVVADLEGGKRFYAEVFGFGYDETEVASGTYAIARLAGRAVGGLADLATFGGETSHWRTYFAVTDPDLACERVKQLGGTVTVPPFDTPAGRMAAVTGPHAEAFLLAEPPTVH